MPLIAFKALGEPKSQPRPKAARRGRFVHIYTPATAKQWKGLVAKAADPFLVSGPLEGPLAVSLRFQFVRPKSHFKKSGGLTSSAPSYHTKKPDVDNLAKAVMDALTDCGLWKDDDQVVCLSVTKRFAKNEGCMVTIDHADTDHVPDWDN